MKKALICFCAIGVLLVFHQRSVHAGGSGIYAGYQGGLVNEWGMHGFASSNYSFFGGGLLFDTNVGKDALFNYRLTIGGDAIIGLAKIREYTPIYAILYGANSFQNIYGSLKYNYKQYVNGGLQVNQAFGFGVVRTDFVRFWLGPEILIGTQTGGIKGYYSFYAGGGFILGVNLKFTSTVALSITAGCDLVWSYRVYKNTTYNNYFWTYYTSTGNLANALYLYDSPKITESYYMNGYKVHGALRISVIFRYGESS